MNKHLLYPAEIGPEITVELSVRNSKKDTEEFGGLGASKCLISSHLIQRDWRRFGAHSTCFIHGVTRLVSKAH